MNAVRLTAEDWRGFAEAVAHLLASWPEDVGRSALRRRHAERYRLALGFAAESETVVSSSPAVGWAPMSASEAADILDVSEVTVRTWCLTGRLRGRKLGTAWAIDPTSVAAELDRVDVA